MIHLNVNCWKSGIGMGVAVLLVLAGCSKGDSYERAAVSGTVTFQGQPVADGEIRFAALPGTMAPVVIESITAGRYATTHSGGVPVGSYRVEIQSYDPSSPPPRYQGDPPRKQLLPAKYNKASELKFVVDPGQKSIARDFKLTP